MPAVGVEKVPWDAVNFVSKGLNGSAGRGGGVVREWVRKHGQQRYADRDAEGAEAKGA